jgi:N-acetylglucosamine-6-sulfatase
MRQHRMQIPLLCTILVGLGAAFAAQAGHAQDLAPCAQIKAACEQAGFTQGAAGQGVGLQVDCIRPIMQGRPQPRKANKPLPQVDPQLVAACKARNPNFGETKAPPAQAPAQSTPPSPPPHSETTHNPPSRALSATNKRPNIVFILTDDLSWNLVQYMPHVVKMQRDGVSFANYFVTDSLCCPSRSSIFTGRYPHNTGIFRNVGPDGGYLEFLNRGLERATFATALSAAGYRTAMLGKYLNGYLPIKHSVASGWSEWDVAGNGYPGFNYNINQNGKVAHYGDDPTDYLTDVLSGMAVNFIKQASGTPFLIEIATFAPHAPYTPAPRDANAMPGLSAPHTPAFNAAPDANAPKWLSAHPTLSEADMAAIDKDFRKRAQSVLAVDAMIAELQAAVASIGQVDNTYFVFSSDNGYHMGEHRLLPGKMTAYDTDINVPLIVTGPGIPAGLRVEQIAENIDLCPTFTELGGAVPLANVDGRSLVSLLHGQKVTEGRTAALIEHHGPLKDRTDPDMPAARSGNPTTYEAIRTTAMLYVEYADGEKEYHDLAADPDELRNTFPSLSSEEKASLHATLAAVQLCHEAQNCAAAERPSRSAMQR